jgi:Predicted xylanase/chitin deacetylase
MGHSQELTIVMYHYVRELECSTYPAIKGMPLSKFREQLTYLKRRHQPVTMAEVVHSQQNGDALPHNAVLLTFDDGYRDHIDNAFPLLHDLGIQGSFFPPVRPVRDGLLLDVNRIHFILAAMPDHPALVTQINRFVLDWREALGLDDPAQYWNDWGKANRWDSAETIYVKRMLQVALPETARHGLAKQLFSAYVTSDEASFARELYMGMDDLRLMEASGMHIGVHGASHRWLNSLQQSEQANELDESIRFLRQVGSRVDDFWTICYPYGAWNATLLEELRARNCALGMTTECRVANLAAEDALLLPRLDTNDVPTQGPDE